MPVLAVSAIRLSSSPGNSSHLSFMHPEFKYTILHAYMYVRIVVGFIWKVTPHTHMMCIKIQKHTKHIMYQAYSKLYFKPHSKLYKVLFVLFQATAHLPRAPSVPCSPWNAKKREFQRRVDKPTDANTNALSLFIRMYNSLYVRNAPTTTHKHRSFFFARSSESARRLECTCMTSLYRTYG